MKINRYLIVGVAWLFFLGLAGIIPIQIESGDNYIVTDTLLGIIIFHSPFILGAYVLLGICLIVIGIGLRIEFYSEKH